MRTVQNDLQDRQPKTGRKTQAISGQPESSARDLLDLLYPVDNRAPVDPVFLHRRIKAGKHLVRAGQAFDALYVVNGGFLKTVCTDESGNEQVISFPMKGDLVGADGISDDVHVNDVVALTDIDVVVVPFKRLEVLNQIHPGIEEMLFRKISQQLIEEQFAIIAIGALSVESRVARFLFNCGQRMAALGYSASQFNLRMSRQDMANFLGMKIETVSRTLTQLVGKGLIRVKQREVTILDSDQLDRLSRTGSAKAAGSAEPIRVRRPSSTTSKPRQAPVTSPATPWSALTDVATNHASPRAT